MGREREKERGNVGDDDAAAEVDVYWDVILRSCYGLAVQRLIGIIVNQRKLGSNTSELQALALSRISS